MPCIQGASHPHTPSGRPDRRSGQRQRALCDWAAPFSGRLDSMYVAAPPSSSQWIGNGLVGRYSGCPLITAGGVARQAEGRGRACGTRRNRAAAATAPLPRRAAAGNSCDCQTAALIRGCPCSSPASPGQVHLLITDPDCLAPLSMDKRALFVRLIAGGGRARGRTHGLMFAHRPHAHTPS